jgi:hypothetical protein
MAATKHMPTAAKIVSAVCLGILGWVASEQVVPLMPEDTDFGYFFVVNLGLGLVVGWVVLGPRVGRGYYESFMAGLTGMAALVFWALFFQSLNEMLKQAFQRHYEGPVEAVVDIFNIAVDFGLKLIDVNLISVLVIGGLIAGFWGEWASRRWS